MLLEEVSIGIVGAGGMGSRHAHNLTQSVVGAHVSAVTDIDQGRAKELADCCGAKLTFAEAGELIASDEVDAVVIASPDPTHAELIMACIAAGKPVLTEKPLGMSAAETKEIVDAEVASGRRLIQVGFMRVYDPPHRAVKEVVDRGEIGKTVLVRDVHTTLDLNRVRPIENVVLRSAIHDFHSLRWLSGSEIDTVFVQWVPVVPDEPRSCRYLLVQVSFANGSLGVIELNAATRHGYEVDVEVVGEQGSVETTSLRSPLIRKSGARQRPIESGWLERFDTAYVEEIQAWARSLLDGKPAGPSAWDGYVSVVAADTILQSANEGSPQKVPALERPALYQ